VDVLEVYDDIVLDVDVALLLAFPVVAVDDD